MINTTPDAMDVSETAGLRRVPRQKRSRERVQSILDATSAMLEESGYDELTTTLIAEKAGMSVSSLYQFFANVDAIIAELVRDWTAEFDSIVLTAAEEPFESWVDAMIDGYVDFFRSTPGFRTVYFSGALRGEARVLDRASNTRLEQRLAQLWAERLDEPLEQLQVVSRVVVNIGDALLGLAFRLEPTGDAATIEQAKRVLRLYLAEALDTSV